LLGAVVSHAQDDDDVGGEGGYGGDDYDGYGDGDDYGGGGNYGDPAEHLEGVLELDAKTFDKVVDGDHHAFVFVYDGVEESSKDFYTEFTDVAAELADHRGLILAKINSEEAGPFYKAAKMDAFTESELPGLVYMAKGSLAAEKYDGEKLAAPVTEFLIGKVGDVGTVEALKALTDKFMNDKAGRSKVKGELKAAVTKLEGYEAEYGAYYLKVADKVADKGDEYVKTEFDRLQRMIVSGSLRSEKEAEFKLRCAVLKIFSREKLENHKPSIEEEDEEDEEEKEL